ncbi:hypothetical protein J5N97_022741 [Dioscorea zingiberensis]|uniref:Aspergillus nuclease S1 n=1 Tax=Dioscorea zingiberensis TaxID=325984 RepID=A0A9D5CBH1_9LILI|nr:hypothetical protein J5N97_022741 [Dioscorea zingiberensis]
MNILTLLLHLHEEEKIMGDWSDQTVKWENCRNNKIACLDVYASESITAACQWAYRNAFEGSMLEDGYFLSRLYGVM